jgi:hypothetical protein
MNSNARRGEAAITTEAIIDTHCRLVAREILAGRVVPFLGAGANLCGRPKQITWDPGQLDWLPNGSELAAHLAGIFEYRGHNQDDLTRVSQHAHLIVGSYPLYEELHRLFEREYPPTKLHEFLAEVPSILRRHRDPPRYQLIVTTNYDDLLELAFRRRDEPFDLVSYDAEGPLRGKFTHHPWEGEPKTIAEPNTYWDVSTEKRTVILKIHGAVNRADASRDSYVITEDHYIDYLARHDISRLVPIALMDVLRRHHCLFLGYRLRDWHLRVILNRIWGDDHLRSTSWAIQLDPDPLDEGFWSLRGVKIMNQPLEGYIDKLHSYLVTLGDGAQPNGGREA